MTKKIVKRADATKPAVPGYRRKGPWHWQTFSPSCRQVSSCEGDRPAHSSITLNSEWRKGRLTSSKVVVSVIWLPTEKSELGASMSEARRSAGVLSNGTLSTCIVYMQDRSHATSASALWCRSFILRPLSDAASTQKQEAESAPAFHSVLLIFTRYTAAI